MINIKTECKDCCHNEICKHNKEFNEQIYELDSYKNYKDKSLDDIMIVTLECKLFTKLTYLTKNTTVKANISSGPCNTYDGWGF